MKLTDKLYFYPWRGNANNCNSYLFKGEKIILFDPGHIVNEFNEDCLESLVDSLDQDGFDVSDIDLILCTHGHPDHVEAVSVLRAESDALVGLHKDDEFIVEAIAKRHHSNTGEELNLKPDFYLEEGPLNLGAEGGSDHIEVYHTPGHSPGGVCFHLLDEKALISGDTVFDGSIGRSDLPGGDMAALGRSIEKLSKLENIELLLPGHMGIVTQGKNVRGNFEQIKRYFF
ncbi:MAG: MBL fold metallo-hydrolase [Bacillota bacterium]